MKFCILFFTSSLLCINIHAQQLNLTIEGGANMNFTNQVDVHIRPDITVLSVGNQHGGSLLFTPRKAHILFGIGIYIDKQSNAAGLNRMLYLTGFETISPKRTHYNSIKIPVIMEYNIGRNKKGEKKLDWSGFLMFSQHRNQDDFQLNNGSQVVTGQNDTEHDLNYWTYKTTFVYTTYSLESGFRLTFPLQDQINLTTSLSYKFGLLPIFTTYVDIEVVSHTSNSTLNADFLNVNKGDAILFNIGLRYDFHLKKKKD